LHIGEPLVNTGDHYFHFQIK